MDGLLYKWRDTLERLPRLGVGPAPPQSVTMLPSPFLDEMCNPPRHFAGENPTCLDAHDRLVLRVLHVEVGRLMIIVEKADDDAKED